MMNNNFTMEKWLKASYKLLKKYWIEWLIISVVMSVVFLGLFYFLYQEIGFLIIDFLKEPPVIEVFLLKVAGKIGLFLGLTVLFLNFIDLFMIHTTSQWQSGKILPLENTILKALFAIPMSIIISIGYIIMALIASMFCIFPVIFVVVYFLFIYQALIIEDQGLNSFGRSIELIKQNMLLFMVIPFFLSMVFQFYYLIPIFLVQSLINIFIDPTILGNKEPLEIVETLLKTPYLILFFSPVVFFFSSAANLKSILYTTAFEEARKNIITQNP